MDARHGIKSSQEITDNATDSQMCQTFNAFCHSLALALARGHGSTVSRCREL